MIDALSGSHFGGERSVDLGREGRVRNRSPPQFSRLGTWCPNFFCTSVLLSPVCIYLDGGMGGRRVATYFFAFFSIIYILGLV